MPTSAQRFTFRQRLAVAVLPPLAALLLRLLHRTLRYHVVAEPGAVPPVPPGCQVWCFWHRCLIPSACRFHGPFPAAILISSSFDGELIARTLERLGFSAARGSSSRDGAAGLLALKEALAQGRPAVFTADGPRGPLYRAKPGAVKLAQLTGQPICICYVHPERSWQFRSWDRIFIPKPFSRVAVAWSREIHVPRAADKDGLESSRLELEAALERARLLAEAQFSLPER